MKKMFAAAATAALLMGSTAQATSAQALSLQNSPRAATATGESNELVGTTAWVLAAIALGLVVWGVIELTSDSN
ncbi:hypothetical protein M9978_12260 [Sphingomonas sp. MG17]|jgi:hypothetical protein|uniref:Uncharacterized protein n=1 Tax=Sphingomonas tagetis TaxID=2949092 RepID=A0A9X2KM86_9SPHN|nr:hypothetical protein [Sphingomonas tagetis]MCP3731201.1 hypothetical protein [Sphingomonas tagetis]